MFRTLIYPSSGACDNSVELPHWSYCSWFDVCWSFGVVGLEWYPCCRLHRNSNTHRTKNNTTDVVIQQNSLKLLMMDILMSETCWAHKKWNKIASDIKLAFYSSTTTMMHGPINLRYSSLFRPSHFRFNALWLSPLYCANTYVFHCYLWKYYFLFAPIQKHTWGTKQGPGVIIMPCILIFRFVDRHRKDKY